MRFSTTLLILCSIVAVCEFKKCNKIKNKDRNKLFEELYSKYKDGLGEMSRTDRLGIFKKNVKAINAANRGKPKFCQKPGYAALLNSAEFMKNLLGFEPSENKEDYINKESLVGLLYDPDRDGPLRRRRGAGKQLPKSVDHSSSTGPVENQAHTLAGSLVALKGDPVQTYSVQQLVDCVDEPKDGCNGSDPVAAWRYLETHRFRTADEYPFAKRDTDQKCKVPSKSGATKRLVNGYRYVDNDVEAIKEVLVRQPVVVSICVREADGFENLAEDDIFDISEKIEKCRAKSTDKNEYDSNHAVTLVGYGFDEKTKTPYWIVKNSWSTDWANKGFGRIKMGSNVLNIEKHVRYPVVTDDEFDKARCKHEGETFVEGSVVYTKSVWVYKCGANGAIQIAGCLDNKGNAVDFGSTWIDGLSKKECGKADGRIYLDIVACMADNKEIEFGSTWIDGNFKLKCVKEGNRVRRPIVACMAGDEEVKIGQERTINDIHYECKQTSKGVQLAWEG